MSNKLSKAKIASIDDNPIQLLADRCRSLMPHLGNKGSILSTIENLEFLLGELGISVRYNIILKKIEISIPRQSYSIDNKATASMAMIASKMKQIGMKTDGYREFLVHIADKNQFNPAETWITSRPWDGMTRIPDLCATIEAKHQESANAFLFRWMIGAVAGACLPNGIDSPGILVLQGAQDLGKTWWFRKLVPESECPGLTRSDAIINPHDRDSVSQVVCRWLVELGELDATFKKSEVAALKAFLTRGSDIFRRPYAAEDSEYPRRTAFMASVNPWHFLTDETGNRRFWTIECRKINSYHLIDMQQLWAEVYYKFKRGADWKLNEQEKQWLEDINGDHLADEPLTDALQRKYNWMAHELYWREMTATEVLEEMGVQRITKSETRICADALRKLSGQDAKRAHRGRLFNVPPARQI